MVITSTGNGPPIRAESYRPNSTRVPLQDVEQLPAAELPQTHDLITTSAGESSPIRILLAKSEAHLMKLLFWQVAQRQPVVFVLEEPLTATQRCERNSEQSR